jgi:ribosomal protein S18 acetylase RimI-like enzyme
MQIETLTLENLPGAAALWNAHAESAEMPHKRLAEEDFARKFLERAPGIAKVGFIAFAGGAAAGFAAGCRRAGAPAGYVTFVLVDRAHRRAGAGTALLRAVEQALGEADGAALTALEARFFNPENLEWIVPGTPGHDHPNAPGVDVAGPGYLFMKNNGYRDADMENSYYRCLAGFGLSPAIAGSIGELARQGLVIMYYDAAVHTGLEDLLDDLGSEDWRAILLANAERPGGGLPLLVVADGARVCGFAGPLDVQPSGRGWFAGIGMHSAYRKRGAGKALFSSLCVGLRDRGAGFMTLFTGEGNPARNIYESAGFKIVKTWAGMRKTVGG